MAGSKAERGGPGPLHHLGERLFGYGRRLGFQVGSIEHRAGDPFYSHTRFVERYWEPRGGRVTDRGWDSGQRIKRISEEELEGATRLLIERVNNGTAGWDLIPAFEHRLRYHVHLTASRYIPGRRFSRNYHDREIRYYIDVSSFQRIKDNPRELVSFYDRILSEAKTRASIPYLIQALHSSFYIIGSEGRAIAPYGELAKERLLEISARVNNPETANGITVAIARFDNEEESFIVREKIFPPSEGSSYYK